MHASANNGIGCAEALLRYGANLDAHDAYGYTALMHATEHGHREAVRWLIARGADTHAATENGESALSIAKNLGLNDLVELFQGTKPMEAN